MSNQKQHISLFDKSYTDIKALNYKLYVEISSSSIKHTILNTENNTFIGFEEYRLSNIYNDYSLVIPLKDIIENNPIYKKEFKTVNIAFVNNRSTLVPNAIFKADKLISYHQFNFSKQEEDLFFSDQLINLSAQNIYSIPDYITTIFSDIKNVSFKHFSSALIEATLIYAKSNKALSLIHIHVLPTSFQVIVIYNFY